MRAEVHFLLYAVQQRWLTEDQAKELWREWEGQPEAQVGIDQVARDLGLLEDAQAAQGLAVTGLSFDPEAIPSVGEYELVERIGAGGHGMVFRAQPELTADNVALKLLAPRLHDDLLYLEEFGKRAAALKNTEIENAATTLEAGESEGHRFIVSEYIPGQSLVDRIAEHGPLPEEEVVRIAIEVTRSLVHVHEKGLAHGGIQAADIRLTEESDVRLLDIGLAKERLDPVLLQVAFRIGAGHTLAPEQAAGEAGDIRSDIFSLGAVLYLAATGKEPFKGEHAAVVWPEALDPPGPTDIAAPNALNPGLSDHFCAVLARMMAREASERYPSPGELLEDLQALSRDEEPAGATSWPETVLFGLSDEDAGAGPEKAEEGDAPGAPARARKRTGTAEDEKATEETKAIPARGRRRARASRGTREKRPVSRGKRAARAAPGAEGQRSVMPLIAVGLPLLLILGGVGYLFLRGPEEPGRGRPRKAPERSSSVDRRIKADLNRLTRMIKKLAAHPSSGEEYLEGIKKARETIQAFENRYRSRSSFKRYKKALATHKKNNLDGLEHVYEQSRKDERREPAPSEELVINPGFEEGEFDTPFGWSLRGKNGKWETEGGVGNKRCLRVSSGSYWCSVASPVEQLRTYHVTVQMKAQAEMVQPGRNVYVYVGYGQVNFEPRTEWKKETFFCTMPSALERRYYAPEGRSLEDREMEVRLGVYGRPEKILFDNLSILPIKPVNRRYKDIELGLNESLSMGRYNFDMRFKTVLKIAGKGDARPRKVEVFTNYSRCLYEYSGRFVADGWNLHENSYVTYRHTVGDYEQVGKGYVSFTTAAHGRNATLAVEMCNTDMEWVEVARLTAKATSKHVNLLKDSPVTKKLYPSKAIFVRFKADGPCRLIRYTYATAVGGELPKRIRNFIGKTEF